MAVITILWGGCMIGMGFVKKWDEMAGLRVVLGFLEAGEPIQPFAAFSQLRKFEGGGEELWLIGDRLFPELCLPAEHLVHKM